MPCSANSEAPGIASRIRTRFVLFENVYGLADVDIALVLGDEVLPEIDLVIRALAIAQ